MPEKNTHPVLCIGNRLGPTAVVPSRGSDSAAGYDLSRFSEIVLPLLLGTHISQTVRLHMLFQRVERSLLKQIWRLPYQQVFFAIKAV